MISQGRRRVIQNFKVEKMGNTAPTANDEPSTVQQKSPTTQDPRSPSKEISRTPLRIDNSRKNHQLNVDPRSPSGVIDRTPIQLAGSNLLKGTSEARLPLNYENVPNDPPT